MRGEFAENAIRKDFLPSEAVAIKRALEPVEKAAAKERMAEGGKGRKVSLPSQSRDRVAAYTGHSGRTLDKAEAGRGGNLPHVNTGKTRERVGKLPYLLASPRSHLF